MAWSKSTNSPTAAAAAAAAAACSDGAVRERATAIERSRIEERLRLSPSVAGADRVGWGSAPAARPGRCCPSLGLDHKKKAREQV